MACRCTARFRALVVLVGWAGIAGFCAAGAGFFAGVLNEAQYLTGVVASLGMYAASVLVAHLGDPYELKRVECQHALALRAQSVQAAPDAMPRVSERPVASPPHAAMN